MPTNWTRIDACEHRWERTAPDRVQCQAGCQTVLVGEMAAEPPVQGMDWSRAALVRADRLPPVPKPAPVPQLEAER